MAQAASAQDVAQADSGVEAVSVTGTRIVRDGYSAPTPVTVVGAEQIQAAAPANLADFVNSSLPSVIGSETSNNSSGSLSNGLAGINALNLRSLGVNRTLILLDGHRTPASAATGDTDINTIPQQLVKRVDVVTGGASADYGSDAVGGVVNFILDKEFTGFKAAVEYGETDAGLQPSYKVNGTYGMDFDGGKGHALISGEWVQTAPTPKDYNPAWNKSGFFKVQNPAYNAVTNSSVPFYLIQPGIGASQVSPGGLVINSTTVPAPGKTAGVTSTAFGGTYFGVNAVINNLAYGTTTGPWMIGGDTAVTQANYGGTNSLAAGENRQSIYTRGSYYVTPDIEVWAEGSISRYKGFSIYQQPPQVGGITIKNDNAFLPASVRAAMVAQGIASLNMGSTNSGFPESGSLNGREVWRAAVGADGNFNLLDTDWKWDYYAQYGMANTREQETPVWNNARLALAQDAVFVTAANAGTSGLAVGSIACRSTLTAPTNGCVPLSRIGINGGTQAPAAFQQGLNYVLGTPFRTQRLQEQSTGFNVSGTPLSDWAGPISVAFGAEWRLESINGFVPTQYNSGWLFGNYLVNKGHYSVAETYLETVVPLMTGLDFNGAYRYTAYSTSGGVSTWKTGLTYSPFDDIKFRVTYSHDIRAPNLNELFAAGTARTNTVAVNNNSLTFVQNQTGNPNLSPEAANSLGLGTVITPTMIPGLALSVDYYNINIGNGIGSLSGQQIVTNCFQGQAIYCAAIQRDPASGLITVVNAQPFNLASQEADGIDFEASYSGDVSGIVASWPGSFNVRALATNYLKNYSNNGLGTITDTVGQNQNVSSNTSFGPPKWSFLGTLTYNLKPFSGTFSVRGISSGVYALTNYSLIGCGTSCPTSTTTATPPGP